MIHLLHARKRCTEVESRDVGGAARTGRATGAGGRKPRNRSPRSWAAPIDGFWMVGAVPARWLGRVEGEALVRASAETGWACTEVDLRCRDAKEPAADEIRLRVVDARDGRQIDQGQIQDHVESCLGGAASGAARHYLPEASASRLGA